MKNEIVQKLRTELIKPVDGEPQVVYVLVEIRKLIDHSPHKNQYRALKFYCDWALHIKLDQGGACQMLQQFDEALTARNDEESFRAAVEKFGPTISFATLRDEFINFLIEYDLPTEVAGKMLYWGRFLALYLSVVKDCPLAYSRNLPLHHIDELRLSRYDDPPNQVPKGAVFAFGITWSFYKNGKEVGSWNNEVYFPKDPNPGAFYDFSASGKPG